MCPPHLDRQVHTHHLPRLVRANQGVRYPGHPKGQFLSLFVWLFNESFPQKCRKTRFFCQLWGIQVLAFPCLCPLFPPSLYLLNMMGGVAGLNVILEAIWGGDSLHNLQPSPILFLECDCQLFLCVPVFTKTLSSQFGP